MGFRKTYTTRMQAADENDQGEGTSHLRSLGKFQNAQERARTTDGTARKPTRNFNRNSASRDRSRAGHGDNHEDNEVRSSTK